MEKIKTGIIGCGKVAHIHAAGLQAIEESDFTAVWSRTAKHAQAFAEQYKVKAYSTIADMVIKGGVQAVIICTPHPFHAEVALQAMEAGAHVLIEKPLASSLRDCDIMLEAASKAGVKIGMVSQRRLYEPVARVKRAIEEGKIGKPAIGTVQMLGWRDKPYYDSDAWRGTWQYEGGGVLVNQAPHQLDILQWYMGPIDQVFGLWRNLNHPYIEVDDTAVAIIKFKNGAIGNVLVSNSQKPGIFGKVHVHGNNGASVGVQTDGGAMFIAGMSEVAEPPINDLWTVPGEEEMLKKWQDEDARKFQEVNSTEYYHHLQIRDFLQSIIDDRDPMVTGSEGRKTVELFTAIYRSNRENKPVQFPLPSEEGTDDFDGRLAAER